MADAKLDIVDQVRRLQDERVRHLKAVADIDSRLNQIARVLGAPVAVAPPAAAAAAAPAPRRRKRRRFAVPGDQAILNFIREKRNPTTAEINAQWRKEGRGGSADNLLTKLCKEKKVKRQKIVGGRGSRYTLA